MEKPKMKHGISNSRQISDGQNLRILIKGTGVFKSQLVKNAHDFLTVSRPTSEKMSNTFPWEGKNLSVYFWRDEDAGYVFDTDVLDEVFSKGLAALKISHSDSLFRTQKRKSIRIRMHRAAFLYPVINEENALTLETNPGLKCFIEDLSDAGCAIAIGGKASADFRAKVQFTINNVPICMSGTVRSVEYKEEPNRSLLHIEADPLPIEVRNKILGEIFGMLPEEEEDLPFRLLGEEAEEMAADSLPEEFNPEFNEGDSDNAAS
jgi:c-di-GMP-binding flagellar brake protein YcgR